MEKYGEIPKKFSAKWFEYVWDYYRWHIIVVLLVIVTAGYTWHSIANRTVYDLTVCLAGDAIIDDAANEQLCSALGEVIEDINGDGEKNVKILDFSNPDSRDTQFMLAMQQKLLLEMQTGDSYLYLISKEQADIYVIDSATKGLFAPASEWYGGGGTFVSLNESTLLKSSGVTYGELYAGVRNFVADVGEEESDRAQRNNSILAANALLGE